MIIIKQTKIYNQNNIEIVLTFKFENSQLFIEISLEFFPD